MFTGACGAGHTVERTAARRTTSKGLVLACELHLDEAGIVKYIRNDFLNPHPH